MMSILRAFWRSRNLFLKMVLLHIVLLVLVAFDIPIARQIFVFLYIAFVPGLVLLRVLNFENLQLLETILLSLGLSIAFLMFTGLFLNELAPLVGISTPLTTAPLIITLSSILLVICFLSSPKDQKPQFQITENLKLLANSPLAILFVSLPLLSVLGTIWVNVYANNMILLSMIIAVSILFVVGAFFKKLLPSRLYPLVVLMIAVSLLFHCSLVSKYLISGGSDILLEHSVFMITEDGGRWNPIVIQRPIYEEYGRYNAMLSITILPTIYSSLMNLDATWVLKILYPLIFSFVPLALYRLWQPRVGAKGSLIAAFLFMAQQTFFTEMLGLARQMIGELFFVLLFLVILNAEMKPLKRMICFAIFGAALIVSHYAMSIIFLFFVFFAWIVLTIRKRWTTKITLTMILLFFVLMFAWYIYTSNSATFNTVLEFGDHVYSELDQWANPASRGTDVLKGLGMEPPPSVWNSISRAFAYLIQFLIVAGFVGLVTRKAESRLDREYLTFTTLSVALLVALIVVPALAETLRMTRFYHILLFFLAPLAIIGAEFLIKLALKRRTELIVSILLIVVLTSYFLFQTNFVYEVTGSDSWSIPLSGYRMDKFRLYVHEGYIDDESASGVRWLLEKAEINNTDIYADLSSRINVLSYYGVLYKGYVTPLTNTTVTKPNGLVYLNRLNVVNGVIVSEYHIWKVSELPLLNSTNKIYSNGGSEIYGSTLVNSTSSNP